jgi:hypothetical protein
MLIPMTTEMRNTDPIVSLNGTSPEHIQEALNDLIHRRTSPYAADDPHFLLGEHLILTFPGCLFVGFEDLSRNPSTFFIGISQSDQQKYASELARAMNEENAVTISVSLYRDVHVCYSQPIELTIPDYEQAIRDVKENHYWATAIFSELDDEFVAYINDLRTRLKKVVLFWSSSTPSDAKVARAHLPAAVVRAFPVLTERETNTTVGPLPTTRVVDDIDVMRWFGWRFENSWHLQPNEQMGFLVLEAPSRPEAQSTRPGDVLSFPGWLGYKYTGSLFLRSPVRVVRLVRQLHQIAHEIGSREDSHARTVARRTIEQYLNETFKDLRTNTAGSITEVGTSDIVAPTCPSHTVQLRLPTELNRRERDTSGEYAAAASDVEQAIDALELMRRHLQNAIERVDQKLAQGDYLSEWLRPILRSDNFEEARKRDERQLQAIVRRAATLRVSEPQGDETSLADDVPNDDGFILRSLFYLNLFARRVLLETPQSLDIGFAPYFMEVGFADPEHLIDASELPARLKADVTRSDVSGATDIIYKLLGELELLFGIGNRQGWKFYMPAAPLLALGQRRGFIFVAGYYHENWAAARSERERLRNRVVYLSRLLRANAYYASRELQEAYARRFKLGVATWIRDHPAGSYEGRLRYLPLLFNMTGVEIDDADDEQTATVRDAVTVEVPVWRKKKGRVQLLPGESEQFLTSGLFPLLSTLSDWGLLESLADGAFADFWSTAAHYLSNVFHAEPFPFETLLAKLPDPLAVMLLRARVGHLAPRILFPFRERLARLAPLERPRQYRLVEPLIEAFRRAVNLYFSINDAITVDPATSRLSLSDKAERRGLGKEPLTLRLSITDPQIILKDVRFVVMSKLVRTIEGRWPTDIVQNWHDISQVAPSDLRDAWSDVVTDSSGDVANLFASCRTTTISDIGLTLILEELCYNACRHGSGVSICASLISDAKGCWTFVLENEFRSATSRNERRGLEWNRITASNLGLTFAYDKGKAKDGLFSCRLSKEA